jgi:hypothetical protein
LILAATNMPRLTALKTNPNGIQIHQPRVGALRLPWEIVPANSSTLKELNQIHHRAMQPLSEMSAKGDVFESGSLQR